jgi:hypothetical protein
VCDYPWYKTVTGDEIEQGDILCSCPVFLPPKDLADEWPPKSATFGWKERDVIVMTQSCDLVKDREKVKEVLLCPLWKLSEIDGGYLATDEGREHVRRGNLPGYHMVNACGLTGHEVEVRIVDFRRVHVLPLAFVRCFAEKSRERLRLLPPYREQLSQAFARFFMRVGLPTDIRSFADLR